jgi:hypothetical protein
MIERRTQGFQLFQKAMTRGPFAPFGAQAGNAPAVDEGLIVGRKARRVLSAP